MMGSSVFRVTLFVVALTAVVIADPRSVITIKSIKVTNNPNDYFDAWETEVVPTKRSSQLNMKIPTKKELPETLMMKLTVKLNNQDPIDYESTVCEALTDRTIGKSFVDSGLPKGKFPKSCPFTAGDWTVSKWDPPVNVIPPGTPDGPVTGTVLLVEEGKDPLVKLDFEGELSHKW